MAVMSRYADVLDSADWDALPDLLADDLVVTLVHTGEVLDKPGYVALNRDYPVRVRFTPDDLVVAGDREVLHARVWNDEVTLHVACFATVVDGRISRLVEVWTDAVTQGPPSHRS